MWKIKIIRNKVSPVSEEKLAEVIEKVMEILDGLIDDNNYHSTMELNLMNELNTIKNLMKEIAEAKRKENLKNEVEVA